MSILTYMNPSLGEGMVFPDSASASVGYLLLAARSLESIVESAYCRPNSLANAEEGATSQVAPCQAVRPIPTSTTTSLPFMT